MAYWAVVCPVEPSISGGYYAKYVSCMNADGTSAWVMVPTDGQPIYSGNAGPVALTVADAVELSGGIAFVLALAWVFRVVRQKMFG